MDFSSITPELFYSVILPIIIAIIGFRWYKLKSKLSKIRKLVDDLDIALNDDKISDEEYNLIFKDLLEIVKGEKKN